MSIRANPTAIGLFMIGATILTVVGVITLASFAWFGDRHTFVSYFDESVNGLERGAPVKFRGVPVGTVTELLIQIHEGEDSFRVPVRYEIDLTRLTTETGAFLHLDEGAVLQQQIDDGLRAQLQMESLVTGQLYIELTYRPEGGRPAAAAGTTDYPEIPTNPSLLAAFGTEAGSLVADVLQILFQVNEMLEEVDMQEINTAVVASAQAVESLVGSDELRTAIGELPELADQLGRTLDGVLQLTDRLGETVDPLEAELARTADEVVLTLQATRQAVEETQGLLSTDSGIGYRLEEALTSLRDAADALRVLAISLERTPDMLIRGPSPPER